MVRRCVLLRSHFIVSSVLLQLVAASMLHFLTMVPDVIYTVVKRSTAPSEELTLNVKCIFFIVRMFLLSRLNFVVI